MAKHTPSHSEQAASPKSATQRSTQAALRHPANRRFCATCPAMRPDPAGSYTNRVMDRAEHPLVGYITMLTWDGGSDNPSTRNDVFLAWIDKERRPRAQRREDTIQVVRDFATKYPVLASAVVESIVAGRSDRSIAEELGYEHHTVARMLARGQSILHQLATEAQLYEMAC